MRTVAYRKDADKALRKLPPDVAQRIRAAIARYAEHGYGDVKKVKGSNFARLRVGQYRAIFAETKDAIDVLAIGHRKEVYR